MQLLTIKFSQNNKLLEKTQWFLGMRHTTVSQLTQFVGKFTAASVTSFQLLLRKKFPSPPPPIVPRKLCTSQPFGTTYPESISTLTEANHWSIHEHPQYLRDVFKENSTSVPHGNTGTVGSSYGLLCAGKGYQLHTMQPWTIPEYFPEEARRRRNLLTNLRLSRFSLFLLIFLEYLREAEYFFIYF
jgi:hypothetical protein